MKLIVPAFAIMTLTGWLVITDSMEYPKISSETEILVGTTPCGKMIRPLHKIPLQIDCALVEWKLTFYKDPVSGKPTTYKIFSINRFGVKVTNMYSEPGTKFETEGKWSIVRGTKTYPNAIIYRLNPGNSKTSIDFLKLSDNLFHILDHDGNLMVGNPFWSYTLSRTGS
jgi:hypothetical protein